jgi:hypothetical protein
VPLEDFRHRVGHADTKMTQFYDRSDIETKDEVATPRVKAPERIVDGMMNTLIIVSNGTKQNQRVRGRGEISAQCRTRNPR